MAWGAGLNNFGTTAVVATPAGGDVERKRGRNAVKCLWGKVFLSQNTATLGVCTCYKWLLHPPAYSGFAGASRIGFLPRRGETFPEIDESFADLSAGQDKGSLKGKNLVFKGRKCSGFHPGVPILPVLQGETQSRRSR